VVATRGGSGRNHGKGAEFLLEIGNENYEPDDLNVI
jgi:hypothetical protein